MIDSYLVFLVVLLVIAAIVGDDFVFTVLYLFAGVFIVGRWWSRRALVGVTFKRVLPERVFWGEQVPIRLQVTNVSWLPVVWLRLRESVPAELISRDALKKVISLGPHGRAWFDYTLLARKRGYYPVGPLFASSGDLFGLGPNRRLEGAADHVTVYPRIVLFSNLKLPPSSPLGTLRHHQPIFEDPTRVMGKRDYISGDSLRRIDWKASAAAGRLQVKKFEPSMALRTAIFLNLNKAAYAPRALIDATELAIVVATSLANWVIAHKQAVGLNTNGVDPLSGAQRFKPLLPRKGQGHLMQILDVLARVQLTDHLPLADMLRQESAHLPWGTTLILISGKVDERLFDELFRCRRAGLHALLIVTGQMPDISEAKSRADHFGFPLYHFRNELDLDVWRG